MNNCFYGWFYTYFLEDKSPERQNWEISKDINNCSYALQCLCVVQLKSTLTDHVSFTLFITSYDKIFLPATKAEKNMSWEKCVLS